MKQTFTQAQQKFGGGASSNNGTGTQPQHNRCGSLHEIKFPAMDDRPRIILYKQPFTNEGRPHDAGVYYHGIKEEKDADANVTEVPTDDWFLSVLEVIAITRTRSGDEHSYLIEYVPHGEK